MGGHSFSRPASAAEVIRLNLRRGEAVDLNRIRVPRAAIRRLAGEPVPGGRRVFHNGPVTIECIEPYV